MFRDISDREIKYLVGLVSQDGIVNEEKAKLIKRLEGDVYNRELVNTSCTLWKDQVEIAQSTENASQFYRNCIDYYLSGKEIVNDS